MQKLRFCVVQSLVGLNCPALYPDFAPVRAGFHDHGILPQRNNAAHDSAGGGDFVACLQIVPHVLRFFFPLSLRADEDELHGHHNQKKGQELYNGQKPGTFGSGGSLSFQQNG